MIRIHKIVAVVSIFLLCCAVSGCGSSDTNDSTSGLEVRNTVFGQIAGVNDINGSGTYYWKGIPYAKPPVGDLRWTAPVDPNPWISRVPIDTKSFGNSCIQNSRIVSPGTSNTYDATIGTNMGTPVGNEDCLSLNIWRPATATTNLPVVMFIHGGGDTAGYSADPMYDGANLAKTANAIIVTVNYRLGPFGFFNLPQLKTGANALDDSGNFAILDQIQALKFIQNNIASFGGNKDNVTVMGQSAGGTNTWALVTSPLTAGLLHKAIPISGGISLATNLPAGNVSALSPASTFLAQANALLYYLLIADGKATDLASAQVYVATQSNAEIASYIRSIDAKTILTVLAANGLEGSGPIPEGVVVPTNPIAAIAAGNYRKIPILVGSTADEIKLLPSWLALMGGKPGFIISDQDLCNLLFSYNPDDPPTVSTTDIIDASYLPVDTPVTGWNAKTTFLNSVSFIANRNNALNTLSEQQSNIWSYQFDWAQEPAPWNDIYGAAHGFGLFFMFGNFDPSGHFFAHAISSNTNKAGRLALSGAMMNTIAAFAATGDPNNSSLEVTWPTWPKILHFDATLTDKSIFVQ